jgi:hypothetical protein
MVFFSVSVMLLKKLNVKLIACFTGKYFQIEIHFLGRVMPNQSLTKSLILLICVALKLKIYEQGEILTQKNTIILQQKKLIGITFSSFYCHQKN